MGFLGVGPLGGAGGAGRVFGQRESEGQSLGQWCISRLAAGTWQRLGLTDGWAEGALVPGCLARPTHVPTACFSAAPQCSHLPEETVEVKCAAEALGLLMGSSRARGCECWPRPQGPVPLLSLLFLDAVGASGPRLFLSQPAWPRPGQTAEPAQAASEPRCTMGAGATGHLPGRPPLPTPEPVHHRPLSIPGTLKYRSLSGPFCRAERREGSRLWDREAPHWQRCSLLP